MEFIAFYLPYLKVMVIQQTFIKVDHRVNSWQI